MKKIILITGLLLLGLFVNAQNRVWLCDNDSALLVCPTQIGNIQWEISADNLNWNDLFGKTNDTLKVLYSADAFYRARYLLNNTLCYSNIYEIVSGNTPNLVDAGRDTVVYSNALVLSANITTIDTSGIWTIDAGDTSATFSNSTLSNAVFSGDYDSTYILRWTVSNGTCSRSDYVSVTFKPLGIASARADNTVLNQLQIGRIYVNSIPLTQNSYAAYIGDSLTGLTKFNDTTLFFIMPMVNPGIDTLTAMVEGFSISIPMTVISLPAVSDPNAYVVNFINSIYINPAWQNGASLQNEMNQILVDFNLLSPDDKAMTAAFLQANMQQINEINQVLSEFNTSLHSKDACSALGGTNGTFYCLTLNYLASLTKMCFYIGATHVAAIAICGPAVPLCSMAVLLIATKIIDKLNLVKLVEAASYQDEFFRQILIKTSIYSDDGSKSTNGVQDEFVNGTNTLYYPYMILYNIQDKSYEQIWLNRAVRLAKQFKVLWNNIFGTANTPDFAPLMKDTITNFDNQYLSFYVSGNSDVSSVYVPGGNPNFTWVKFITSEEEDQEYFYRVRYEDSEFKLESDRIDATLLVNGVGTFTLTITDTNGVSLAPITFTWYGCADNSGAGWTNYPPNATDTVSQLSFGDGYHSIVVNLKYFQTHSGLRTINFLNNYPYAQNGSYHVEPWADANWGWDSYGEAISGNITFTEVTPNRLRGDIDFYTKYSSTCGSMGNWYLCPGNAISSVHVTGHFKANLNPCPN